MTTIHEGGKLVRLESGGWAQYRPVVVQGPVPVTIMIAVELTEEEVRKLVPENPEPRTLH